MLDKVAEQRAVALGARVLSIRPVKDGDTWYCERWWLGGPDARRDVLFEEPSWADYASAMNYIELLVAEQCDRMVVFQYGRSRDAADMIFAGEAADKQVYTFTEENDGTQS